jgi:hypothetical protein
MAKAGKPAFSPEEDTRILERMQEGEHYLALAVELEVSPPTIYAARARALKAKQTSPTPPTQEAS